VGAGIGHLALPLGERRLAVTAVEPAEAMLAVLRAASEARDLPVRAVHAAAEALPIEAESMELVVVADALHFLDAELTGRELRRVLTQRGVVAVITCEPADTPFMRALGSILEAAAPRRPRRVSAHLTQLFKVAGVTPSFERRYLDVTPLDHGRLERILRSVSFIGPAMNAERFARFSERVRAVPGQPEWARQITLHVARRAR
jgi:ubiquinone/menaquinone biosynthesis C-methylase UbiE